MPRKDAYELKHLRDKENSNISDSKSSETTASSQDKSSPSFWIFSENALLVFCLVFLIAFFPGIFHWIWTLPFKLLPTSREAIDSVQPHSQGAMSWFQKEFSLAPKSRGCYLVTDQVRRRAPSSIHPLLLCDMSRSTGLVSTGDNVAYTLCASSFFAYV